MFSLFDLLPMPFWLGPPMPRFLGVYWPQMQSATSQPEQYVSDVEIIPAPLATYSNEESWEIEWSPDGLPTRIVVHRNAKRQ